MHLYTIFYTFIKFSKLQFFDNCIYINSFDQNYQLLKFNKQIKEENLFHIYTFKDILINNNLFNENVHYLLFENSYFINNKIY